MPTVDDPSSRVGATTPDDLARQLEHSSIEDVLRMQDQLAQLMREKYERRVAVLFSDIAGSTAYFEQHGDAAGRRMIQRHNDMLVPTVQRFNGRVVKTIGDALMATFPDAQAAVDAAIAMQQAVRGLNVVMTHDAEHLDIRIGINFGNALVNDKDGDVYGDMVNVAARVQAAADRAQILVSEAVKEQISPQIRLRPAGAFTLKGKSQPFELHEVLWGQLAATAELDRPEVDGRYTLMGPLGRGGMASVWRARDEHLCRDVALKVLHPHLPLNAAARERFKREAQVAAGLAHDNVVQTFDYSAVEGRNAFIALELVEGETLRALMERRGKLPSVAVGLIAHELARALAYAHARGVVHRDVKPDNVLISAAGAVKLSDFGIALVGEMVRLTGNGLYPMGTPGFVPPEQLKGEPVRPQSDLFALGVLMYELLTAKPPFPGETPQEILYRVLEGGYTPPEDHAEVDPEISALVRRCLAADWQQRPGSAEEIAAGLEAYLSHFGIADPRAALARYFSEGTAPPRGATPSGAFTPIPLVERSGPHPALAARPASHRRQRWPRLAAAGGAVLAVVAALAIVGEPERPAGSVPAEPVPAELAVAPEPAVEDAPDSAESPAADPPAAEPSPAPAVSPPPPHAAATPQAASRPAARKPRAPAGTGTLKVHLARGWAEIHVNGVYRGTAPQTTELHLPAGRHNIRLLNKYMAPYERRVRVRPGRTVVLRAELQPLP